MLANLIEKKKLKKFRKLNFFFLSRVESENQNINHEIMANDLFEALFDKMPEVNIFTKLKEKDSQEGDTFYIQTYTICKYDSIEEFLKYLFSLVDLYELVAMNSIKLTYSKRETHISFNFPLEVLLSNKKIIAELPLDIISLNISFIVTRKVFIKEFCDLIDSISS